MRLAGYIRVSTEQQVDAYGKDVQRQHITEWATLNGHTIVEWYEEDAVSGKSDDAHRPALREILDQLVPIFDGVVMFDATRLARRLFMQETLLNLIWATGLKVFTTTNGELEADEDDPMKILIRQVVGAVAEFEHRSIVIKLHTARKLKSSRGGYVGGTPRYGRAVQGTGKSAQFVEDEVESEVIGVIANMHEEGMSLREIARTLNDKDIPTKVGGVWHASQISRIIKRSLNA